MSAPPTYGFNSLGLQLALAGVLGASRTVDERAADRRAAPDPALLKRTARFNRSIKLGYRYTRTHKMYLTKPC
jgi:hypothetical protein